MVCQLGPQRSPMRDRSLMTTLNIFEGRTGERVGRHGLF